MTSYPPGEPSTPSLVSPCSPVPPASMSASLSRKPRQASRPAAADDHRAIGVTPMTRDDTPVHAEDVTVSVTVRVTLCRPEEDRVYSVAKPGGERIHGYIRHRS